MFTDRVQLRLIGGRGGSGIVAWRRERHLPKGGPFGGNGGHGGSIIISADKAVHSLDFFRNRFQIQAPKGLPGGTQRRQGKRGKDLILKVPCGTILLSAEKKALIYDFTEHGQTVRVCLGGKGGKGNAFFKSATVQAPSRCTPGLEGEMIDVQLELKLIADVGLIGCPNAGKSTLLNQIAQVQVKTGAYPFTTLTPKVSYIPCDDFSRIYIADIPGMIAGAHNNRGLGLSFLRHVERCQVLLFVIDIAATDGRDPTKDFALLQKEIAHYSPHILEKPFLVALNKVDCEQSDKYLSAFTNHRPFSPYTLFPISALKNRGISPLLERVRQLIKKGDQAGPSLPPLSRAKESLKSKCRT